MVTQRYNTNVSQLASKLLHFYLATGRLPSPKEHNAAPHLRQEAMELLARNGYLPSIRF